MPDQQGPPEITWLTLNDLAGRWRVCKRTIRRIDVDDLPCFLINRLRRYRLDDIVRYERSRAAGHLTDPETEKET